MAGFACAAGTRAAAPCDVGVKLAMIKPLSTMIR